MIQCPKCKQMLEAGARFCPNDGTPLTETSAQNTVPTPAGDRPKSRDIALPVVVGGRYRLDEKRGGGGMAKVYRATDVTLQREVAVKLINQELREEEEFDARFQREARIASQLADPHIVVVHDYGIDSQYGPYLVMEYLRGETLRERLHNGGVLPYKAGLQMGAQLLLALIHAHDKNILHRDIKPDNIFLLNQSGVRLHLRVLDFGIARMLRRDDAGKAETLTSPGAVLGTPRYMSPEQLAGRPLDARSDLYSAAVVLHEALTGELPHVSGKSLSELCPDATPAFQELLEQCLKPNPADRPGSALEIYLRLQELGKASGVLLLPPGALEKLAASRRKASDKPQTVESATTKAYGPCVAGMSKSALRLLIALGVALALVGAAIVLRMLFWPPAPPVKPGPESLLGVKIGDPMKDVVDNLSKEDSLVHVGPPSNPWEKGPSPDYLGRVLAPQLLNVSAGDLQRLDLRRTKDDKLCVVFLNDKVVAVAVQQPHAGDTGRGVGVSSPESLVTARYGDRFTQEEAPAGPRGQETLIRTYKTLGIGFEIQDGKVTGATLFPVPSEY